MQTSIALANCLVLACGLACAQSADSKAAFEVASVKEAAPDARGMRCTGGPGTNDPGALTCDNYSLSYLIMMAYDLRPFQFSAPAWMGTARYNVVAKIPSGTTLRQFRLMQQNLLAERFGLKAHFERKKMQVLEMTVAKSGLKLKEVVADAPPEDREQPWRPPAGGPPRRTMASVHLEKQSMTSIVKFVSNQLGQPVTDATGLKGLYDFAISFMMEPGGRAAEPSADASDGPTLIDALREQLGLRLDKTRGQADVLVVDLAERVPTEK